MIAVRRRWRPSLRVRITSIAVAVVAVVLAAGGIALGQVLRRGLVRSASGSALERTAEITSLAGRGPLPAVLPPIDAPRRTLIQVLDTSGTVIAATPPLVGAPTLLRPGRAPDVTHDEAALGPGGWLVQPTAATLNGRPATVVVYTSTADIDRTMRVFVGLMLVALPMAAGFVAVVVWTVAGRALAPVEAMRQEVDVITATSLDRRVPEPLTSDEIGRLATTLNNMLSRLSGSNDTQRRFMADASHELRTPLANIRAAIEVSLAHPGVAEWPAVAEDVLRQTARLEHLSEDLLILALGDAGARPSSEIVDLAELIDHELSRPAARIVRVGEGGPVLVAGDRHDIGRALTNVVDNALRHARNEVVVGLRSGAVWAEIWVADDGPGVPYADRERIFDRFVRLDEHRDRAHGGAGLGLAISRDLLERNGGTVTLDAHGDGATFRLRIPLSRESPKPLRPSSAIS